MSGLAGVLWLDSARPARTRDLHVPLNSLAHRGPEGLFAHAAGECALGFAKFATTPEAERERQPHLTPSGLVVTLDGRIDNLDDLRRALDADVRQLPTDVAVVGAAWDAWGSDALARLLGDFALAVWDPRSHTVVLARDVFGLRPLYYREHNDGFWWATELQALARLGGSRVNQGMVAENLTDSLTNDTETLVQGVLRLPRASWLRRRPDSGMEARRYWAPRIERPRARADGQVVEEFRAIFSQAVAARLRTNRPAAILLSGGLDSSLVCAEAATLAQRGATLPISAYTLQLRGHPADESPYAQAVARHLRVPATLCEYGPAALEPIVADAYRALDLPLATNCVAGRSLSTALSDAGVRVCLNGNGGNEWFSGNHFALADHLRAGRLVQLAKRVWSDAASVPHHRPWSDLRLALWLQLPDRTKRRLRGVIAPRRRYPWLQPSFAARTALSDRLQVRPVADPLPTIQQRIMWEKVTSADKMFFFEYTERVNAAVSSEERMPFFDRRLAEWALALPDEHRSRNGAWKVVLRHAATPVLPEVIVHRGRGPDFSFQTAEGLHQIGGEALVMAIAERRRDWVSREGVQQLWAQMTAAEHPNGQRLGHYSWLLWLLVATDAAVTAIEHGGARTMISDTVHVEETVA